MPSFHSLKRKFYLSFFILLTCKQKLPFHDMYWLAKKVSSSNNYSIFHHSSASFIIWFMRLSINKWQLCLLLALIPQSSLHHLQLSKQAGFSCLKHKLPYGNYHKKVLIPPWVANNSIQSHNGFFGIIPWSIFFGHMSFGGSFFSMPAKLNGAILPFYSILFAYYFFIFACHWQFFPTPDDITIYL